MADEKCLCCRPRPPCKQDCPIGCPEFHCYPMNDGDVTTHIYPSEDGELAQQTAGFIALKEAVVKVLSEPWDRETWARFKPILEAMDPVPWNQMSRRMMPGEADMEEEAVCSVCGGLGVMTALSDPPQDVPCPGCS